MTAGVALRARFTGGRGVLVARILIGALQAAALYFLSEAAVAPLSWPATQAAVFDPLVLVFAFIPILLLLGAGKISWRPLAIWAILAAAVVAGLGVHDALRGRTDSLGGTGALWPSFPLVLALAGSLFVAHVLVIDGVIEKGPLISYPRHFDTAWKFAVQCGLALVFVGVFWSVLYLGANLFELLNIDYFRRLLQKHWFAFPATTVALAVAVHVTDVQPALIRGARALALTLFSWLLPLLAAILLGFLASLLFVSLAPLWKTHFATGLLLSAAILLVLLINSCYQDGAQERTESRIKRAATMLGAIELIPLVALAAWALALRVGQYGWSVERILAAAVILVAACYALGYALAVVRSPRWMQRLETTNLVAAYLLLSVVLALFSPVADPARLMVMDQLARLRSGAVTAQKFDYRALKFDGARWGATALQQLAQGADGPNAAVIADGARQALALTSRYGPANATPKPVDAADMAQRITVYPAGRALPPAFLQDIFVALGRAHRPYCPVTAPRCIARFVSLGQGQREAILFVDQQSIGYLFEGDEAGHWKASAQLQGDLSCASVRQAIASGAIGLQPHGWPDLMIGGQRIEAYSFLNVCR